ncbi:MAG: RNA methyltransferase [Deltaproteobacteria bacterium]|nr:RNA methyltransferase [Deltaproteobacteria bacterium]
MRLYIGLVHYPVYNRNDRIIASAITTLDLHDLSRLARTYDVRRFFVITPLEDQQMLVQGVRRHWTEGYGATYNLHRQEAIELMHVAPSLELAIKEIAQREGENPIVIATDAAKQKDGALSFERARRMIQDNKAVMVIFGTAWGLEKKVIALADYVLDPLLGRGTYNHLSVRTAAAIILDRLVGV